MFSAFINSFKIKELRTRILFTAGILILCRVAANIPCPGVDTANLDVYFTKLGEESATGQFLGMFDLFSGGALQHFAIGALGIMPYISASIIMQLLTPVVPSLEKLQREGEVGRGKINQYTRYLTIVICLVQGAMAAVAMTNPTRLGLPAPTLPLVSNAGVGFIIMSMIILTAGTMVLVWLGERITENGIGNGVSIIITANIIERLPQSLMALFEMMNSGFSASGTRFRLVHLLLLFVIFAAVTALTVLLTQGQRRVPIQMAKRIVGNKMSGGTTYMPLKVNFPGVMPIIFASSIVNIPSMLGGIFSGKFWTNVTNAFNQTHASYIIISGVLLVAFSYFYIMISFNPVEVANNIKNNGGAIPGIRPGRPTIDFIKKVLNRVTFIGAVFLCLVSTLPMAANAIYMLFANTTTPNIIEYTRNSLVSELAFAGSSLLIITGVVIETTRSLDAQMSLRNYKGFLD